MEQERENLRERTRREARSAAKLQHPSAVTVYDVVEQDGQPFLVMELVEARTLAEVVRDDGPLPPARTATIVLAVLGALEAAHARGIVHRDVKPGNVLLCSDERTSGRVVLTDFGIATSAGDPSLTGTGLLLGSPSYISPERAKGNSPGPAAVRHRGPDHDDDGGRDRQARAVRRSRSARAGAGGPAREGP